MKEKFEKLMDEYLTLQTAVENSVVDLRAAQERYDWQTASGKERTFYTLEHLKSVTDAYNDLQTELRKRDELAQECENNRAQIVEFMKPFNPKAIALRLAVDGKEADFIVRVAHDDQIKLSTLLPKTRNI